VSPVLSTDEKMFDKLETYRRELTGYCYRMLASPQDAEDAVQQTFVRALRSLDKYEDRGGLRPWLYRIATNVCLDMLKGRTRRALPIDLTPAATGHFALGAPLPEATWVQPIADHLFAAPDRDPAEIAVSRESIRLAFIAALQHLAPRQRAVLILRDVLRWKANEVAQLIEMSEDAVNSTLRRARRALESADLDATPAEPKETERALLNSYIQAFERYDVDALVALLHEDVVIAMPPFELWLQGLADARRFLESMEDESGNDRAIPFGVNGSPTAAIYRPHARSLTLEPYSIMVLEVAGGRITSIHAFLDTRLFAIVGLPPSAASEI
jgi:RNA polymerase sigma-70 factor (ECF subfamily)